MKPEAGTPLYLHLPFCAAKCTYCDFYSLEATGQDLVGVQRCLEMEIRERAPVSPRTVFFGGGTPSLYGSRELKNLFDVLDECTGFRESAVEVTVECNPESLDEHKAESLLAAGATRLSIGVQSLRAKTLEFFGRVHTVDQSFRAYEAARRAGATRLNLDLIYASPGQRPEEWREDLERVLALGPEHLSAYNLTFEAGTPIETWRKRGEIAPLDEDDELEMFWITRQACADAGLPAYEISNFSLPGEACAHNEAYWSGEDYVGVGPSAVSRVGDLRQANPRSLSRWRTGIEAGGLAIENTERLTAVERLAEAWWLGLRRVAGVDPKVARARARAGLEDFESREDPMLPIAQDLAEQGLLDVQGAVYLLNERSLPLADAVARRFLDAC